MAFMNSIDIVGSGLTAQQMRLDVISENITNIDTTRTEGGDGAYRRKVAVFESRTNSDSFQDIMSEKARRHNHSTDRTSGGVRVAEIVEDDSEMKTVYDPSHPDADEDGYVEYPNVTLVQEIADAMAASQAYSANVTAFNTLKSVMAKGLEIGV